MTGVSPFLFFHKHTIITIKDATLMSQSTHKHGRKDADELLEAEVLAKDYIENGLSSAHEENGLWKELVDKYKDVPTYPEPQGDPSY